MWERFSYYGMRALLILFLVAAVQTGGFGMTDKKAAAIYGLYTAGVYLMALPGRLDRRPDPRPAPGGVRGRLHHRGRPLQLALPTVVELLPRALPHRAAAPGC